MTTSDHRISFKTGMRTLSHTVTCQALLASGASNNPICYFEVKVGNVQDKDLQTFAIGIAPFDYPVQRACGSKDSVAIRGDGRIMFNDTEVDRFVFPERNVSK